MAAQRMTREQRDAYFFGLSVIDALEIADYVRENHPEVFDAAVAKLQRVLAEIDRTARRTAKQQGDNS